MAKTDVNLLTFADGLQTTTNSFLRKDSQLELAINVHGDTIGSITKRLGYTALGTASGNPGKGLYSYARQADGTTRLFRASGGNLDYFNGSAWANVTTYTPTDARLFMITYIDQLFIVGVNSSGSYISPINVTALTPSTTTNLVGAPKAKCIEVYNDQLYFGNISSGGTHFGSRVQYCDLPDSATESTITWTSTNYESIYPHNGDTITALHTNKYLNTLLIFKNNSVHAWDSYRIRDIGNIGTNSQKAVTTINYTTFYYAPKRGFYSYSGITPTLVSRPIDKWIKGIQDPDAVCLGKEDERILKAYVGTCVVDGKTYNNIEIRYAVNDNAWWIYQYANDFQQYAEHGISNVTRLYGIDSVGGVYQMAQGADVVHSDNGNDISAEFMTKALDLGVPSWQYTVDRAMFYATNTNGLTGRARFRGKDWGTYFNIDKPETIVNINPGQGRFLQFHFSETSQNAPFQFDGLSFDPTLAASYV
jgi:hypothetical protein